MASLAAAVALPAAAVRAQDEHQRRLGAELQVMRGDVRRLVDPATPEQHRAGLRARLAGALSSLPLLLRLAGGDGEVVAGLRVDLAEEALTTLATALAELALRHPLDLSHILPVEATPARVAQGRAIHEATCAGCHDAPDQDVALPALDLKAETRRMPAEELAARLINGIRGDAATALANPFGDAAISALLAFYRQ